MMNYFLDNVGINNSNVFGAFSFYQETGNYYTTNSLTNAFNNLIFYKTNNLINNYPVYFDTSSNYALWYETENSNAYVFTEISTTGQDIFIINSYYNVDYPTTAITGIYDPANALNPPWTTGANITINNVNKNIVTPDLWATSSTFGILNTGINGSVTGSFFQNTGTGFFNGSSIMKLNSPYTFENDTILLSYERLRNGDEILLSSATGNSFSTYSGFCLGVSHANKLYFKYWNSVEGPFTFTAPNVLANKNLVLINRNDDNLTIGTLNNNSVEFELNNFNIKNNVFVQSSELFLGGMYNNVPWANDRSLNFSGYVDKFYIFKDVQLFYQDYLISGIIYTGVQTQGYNESYCYITGFLTGSGFSTSGVTGFVTIPYNITGTGITGYLNINTGYYSYSGVTGYTNVSRGFYSYCNNTVEISGAVPVSGRITISGQSLQRLTGLIITTGYNQIPLSGNITGINQVYTTGQICSTFFVSTGDTLFFKNNNYLKSLSFSEVSVLSPLNKQSDIIEVYHDNYLDKTLYYNRDLLFNFTDDNFINNNFIESGDNLPSGTLFFLNGQTILESGFSIQTIGYDSYIIPNLDYYQSGNTVFVNESIIETDAIFYDYITGDSKILYRTGISSGSQLVGENFINKFVFINGQKLVSGATYTGTNTINLNFPSGDNFILIKSVPTFNYYSGNNSTVRLIKQNLNKDSSQVYLNGIKQKLGNNYIENSDFDLFSGDFFENQNNYIIYNNTDDFFV